MESDSNPATVAGNLPVNVDTTELLEPFGNFFVLAEETEFNPCPAPPGFEEISRARRRHARRFLKEVLFVEVNNRWLKQLTAAALEDYLRDCWNLFRRDHPGTGDDFDLAHVEGLIWQYLLVDSKLIAKKTGKLPCDVEQYQQVWDLFDRIEVDRVCYPEMWEDE